MNLNNDGFNNGIDDWVNSLSELDILQAREIKENSGGRYSSSALYGSDRLSSSRMFGSQKYSDPISDSKQDSPDGSVMNLAEYALYDYGVRFNSKIENTAQAFGLQNSDANKLLVAAMEPLARYDNFCGNKDDVKSKVKSSVLNNISEYIENNNIDPESFANDTAELLSALERNAPFIFEIAKEFINTANIEIAPDLYIENNAVIKPEQKEKVNTNDSEFSPSQYLPRMNMPRNIEYDDDDFSM